MIEPLAPTGDAADARAADRLLILGSNLSPARHLRFACQRIADEFPVVSRTGVRRTRDADGRRYLNAGLRIRSKLAPEALRSRLHAIEAETGRVRGSESCTLDIDLVASIGAMGDIQVHKPDDLQRGYVRNLLGELGLELPQTV